MVRSATKHFRVHLPTIGSHQHTLQDHIVQSSFPTRPRIPLTAPGQAALALQVLHLPQNRDDPSDVLYVHGSTFGADMSIFYRFDRRSWADALNDAGHTVCGL